MIFKEIIPVLSKIFTTCIQAARASNFIAFFQIHKINKRGVRPGFGWIAFLCSIAVPIFSSLSPTNMHIGIFVGFCRRVGVIIS